MNKNQSVWSVLLSVVLAMVVMAGLAVISFAETKTDPAALEAVLNGTQKPAEGVDYDVDGNGIIEWADLDALNGTLEDLLANGKTDMISLPLDAEYTDSEELLALQSLFVRGDSAVAIKYDRADQNQLLDWATPYLDFSSSSALTFDTFWPGEVGSLKVTIISGENYEYEHNLTVQSTQKGWSTAVVDLSGIPAEELDSVSAVYFERAVSGETQVVYIDNMSLISGIPVNFSSAYGSVGAKQVVAGAPYGALPVLTQSFYNFEGWYLDQAYTKKVTADTIVTAEAEHTLYAKWSMVTSDDDSVVVTDKGNNVFGLTTDHSYKQIRFQFNVQSVDGTFAMDYDDGDSNIYNNPVVTIVDASGNALHPSKVQPGQWYTAILYGGSFIDASVVIKDGGNLATSGTLTFKEGAQLQIKQLETMTGQLGIRLLGRGQHSDWKLTDLSAYGYSYGYDFDMSGNDLWSSRLNLTILAGRYTKMTYDFCVYEHATAKTGETFGMAYSSLGMVPSAIYDMDGNKVNAADMKVGSWYRVEFDFTGISGNKYVYSYANDAQVAAGHYKAYFANVNFVGDGSMDDKLSPATTLTVNKSGSDGSFITIPVTRDTDRGVYNVAGDSANWYNRVIRVGLSDTTKELVQLDFRFATSKDGSGKDVAPTLVASTTLSGNLKKAQYIILDENDAPVTTLETGKWYRMFINANGGNAFGLVPAAVGELELQIENLDTYNTDELPVRFGDMSVILTKFGKLEHVYTGNGTVTVDAAGFKQIRFAVKGAVITGSGVTTEGTGEWKTIVVKNNGNDLGTVTLNISGNENGMRIKDLAAYTTAEEPSQTVQSDLFHGLGKDEMMIAGFIGPRDDYVGYYAYDQKSNPMATLVRDDIFASLAKLGINYIADASPSYSGTSLKTAQQVLRLASKYGISYWMPAYDVATIEAPGSSYVANYDAFAEKLDEMKKYEGFGGLYLRDEPSSDMFAKFAEAYAHIQKYNSLNGTKLNGYGSMFPGTTVGQLTNGTGKDQFGNTISGWQDYIKAFSKMGVNYLLFDSYPFGAEPGSVGYGFIDNVSRMAKLSLTEGKPWMGFVQVGGGAISYGGTPTDLRNRVTTEAETHWDVNMMLAFGAKGINYYCLVSAPYQGGQANGDYAQFYDTHSILNTKGEPTAYYKYAADINAHIKAMDHVLMNSSIVGVIVQGTEPYDKAYNKIAGSSDAYIPQITKYGYTGGLNFNGIKFSAVKLNSVSGKHAMIGVFDYNGKTAYLVVNNHLTEADNITLSLAGNYNCEVIANAMTSWQVGSSVSLSLEAGRSALVVLHEGEVSMDATVIFDQNYESNKPAPDAALVPITNAVYPELPVISRPYYDFGGWYTNADCTGTPVKAGDPLFVIGNHTLYAKWTVIEDPNSVTVGSAINGSGSVVHSCVDGEHLYTFSTSGVSGQWGRGVFIGAPEAAGFVAVEFRFTEAKTAGGANFAPSLGILRNGEGNGGQYIASVAIYDENGTQVAASNTETGLNVGQWYTAVIKTINTKTLELYAAHNRTDAPSVKMEIRGRAFATSVPIVGGAANGYYAHAIPVPTEEEPTYAVIVNSRGDGTNEIDRRLVVSVCGAKYQIISMKVNITACTGTPALEVLRNDKLPVGYAITDSEGNLADNKNLKLDEWYTLTWIAEHESLKSYWVFPFLGSGANGTILVKDISVKDLEGPLASTYYTWAAPVADNGTYMCYSFPTGDGTSIGYRQINVTVDAASGDIVSANVMLKNTTGTPKFIVRNAAGAELAAIITDSNGNEIDSTAMELGKWHTISWIADGSATYQLLSFEGTAVNGTYFIKDIMCESVPLNYSFTYGADVGQYYATATKVLFEGDIAYKCVVNSRGDGTNKVDRRVHLNVANSAKQVISMQVYFESCTNTPSIRLHRGDGTASNAAYAVDYFVTDAEGNLCDSHNLELNKWYTVTWLAAGVADYMVMPFEGSATNGTYYVKDVTAADVTGAFASTYYVWVAPYAVGNDTNYFIRARYVTDGTNISHRNITFNTSAASGDVISMKMMMTETSGTPDLQVKNAGGTAMGFVVTDENGNQVNAANMQLNKWYTVSWTADGSVSYSLCTFQGTAANGTYFVKDITVG